MSLSALIERLTALLSKSFVIGAFIPVLLFAALNGAIWRRDLFWFRPWADPGASATAKAADLTAALIGLAVAAYLLSSVNVFLRQVLEGRHLDPDRLFTKKLVARQDKCFSALQSGYSLARKAGRDISRKKTDWTEKLTTAAVEGVRNHAGQNAYDGETGAAAEAMKTLRNRREQAQAPSFEDLSGAVDELSRVLQSNDLNAENGGRKTLADDRRELLSLFDYAEDSWSARELACFNQLQARFGIGAPAPTAMGNIAQSMQSYGITRYGLNLDTFWSRLQPVLQKDETFSGRLQDAKTQLDFLVGCFWLSLGTTIVWVPALAFTSAPVGLFLALALVGPALSWCFYRLAAENYLVFGEMIRTSVDLHRFALLESLHVALPKSLRDERALWNALQKVASFGQEWVDLSYRHESQGSAEAPTK